LEKFHLKVWGGEAHTDRKRRRKKKIRKYDVGSAVLGGVRCVSGKFVQNLGLRGKAAFKNPFEPGIGPPVEKTVRAYERWHDRNRRN